MKTYYINLDRATDRREAFERGAAAHGITPIRIPAVTPAQARASASVCVILSHLKALEAFLATGDEWALLCEDDVCFDAMDTWGFAVEALPDLAPEDAGFVQLAPILAPQHPPLHLARTRHKLRLRWCTAAWLVRRGYAQKLLGTFVQPDGSWSLASHPGPHVADIVLLDAPRYGWAGYSVPILYCNGDSDFGRSGHDLAMHKQSREAVKALLEANAPVTLDALTPAPYTPTISILTPTRNRRHLLPMLERCILRQNYPREKLEWIIVDNSDDGQPPFVPLDNTGLRVIQREVSGACTVGAMRQLTVEAATGEVIVHMDDDDYYPPSRVAHVVNTLQENPDVDVVGCSMTYLYFTDTGELWKHGPYGPNHTGEAAMAYRRTFLSSHAWPQDVHIGEGRLFLDRAKVVQLAPERTMVCIVHGRNTVDKRKLLGSQITSTADPNLFTPYDLVMLVAYHKYHQAGAV